MDLLNVVKSTKAAATNPAPSANMSSLNSDAIFAAIGDRVKSDPAKAKAVNAVFGYKITKDGKVAKEWSKLKVQADIARASPKVAQTVYHANLLFMFMCGSEWK